VIGLNRLNRRRKAKRAVAIASASPLPCGSA